MTEGSNHIPPQHNQDETAPQLSQSQQSQQLKQPQQLQQHQQLQPPQQISHLHTSHQQTSHQRQQPLVSSKHVHHSYIWMGTISVAIALIMILIFTVGPIIFESGVRQTEFRGPILILMATVLFVVATGITLLVRILGYRNLYYALGDEEFNLYSGVFIKKRVHVPYQRIQSVNQKATLLQRLIGVCTVNIDTAGGASNKAIVVPFVQNTEAEILRYELFSRKQTVLSGNAKEQVGAQSKHRQTAVNTGEASVFLPPPTGNPISGQPHPIHHAYTNVLDAPTELFSDMRGVFGADAIDTGRVVFQYGLTNKELFLTGLSNTTGFALFVVSVIASGVSLVGFLLESAFGRALYESGYGFASDFVSSPIGMGVGVIFAVGALLLFWLISVLTTCLSYGGFRATRRGSRIEVERGIIQHHFQGVDIDRVQSVIVKQSFIRKIFGFCELSLGKIETSKDNSDAEQQNANQGLVVHPFVKLERVPEILAGLVPEFADVPTDIKPVAKRALRRAVIRRTILMGNGFWLAVCTTIAFACILLFANPATEDQAAMIALYTLIGAIALYALSAILLIFDVIGAVLWYRGSGYAYNRLFMQVTNSGLSRESVSFPRKKIQYGYTKSNPFQRIARVKTINARTAAGIGGSTMSLRDVDSHEADLWLDWVKPFNRRVLSEETESSS